MSVYIIPLLFVVTVSEAQVKDSIEVMSAATKFVTAFNHFQWQPFKKSFSDDASIFFPVWDYSGRIKGRKEFEKTWLELFPEFINNPSKDSLTISPQDIRVQVFASTAIMSFHLGDPQRDLARRTIVCVKEKETWKIVHLHASRIVNND